MSRIPSPSNHDLLYQADSKFLGKHLQAIYMFFPLTSFWLFALKLQADRLYLLKA